MPILAEDRRAAIKDIVIDILELEDDEVTDTSLFIDDHGADSLRAIEILASLEKEFGITIDQSQLAEMVNLEAVYKVVAEAPAR
ncbi:acyl carrier protein [Streptomyces sp. NPDC005930]|uniref:acyl carrier protein n=1 Tax=Streptomyces sp. NPDC005930 TaxID=3364736 RepID=UPI0036B5A792